MDLMSIDGIVWLHDLNSENHRIFRDTVCFGCAPLPVVDSWDEVLVPALGPQNHEK